jgi:hypothetical protein
MKKPKPIAFLTLMVKAIRRENNPKTMTRRVIKPEPASDVCVEYYPSGTPCFFANHMPIKHQYEVGDVLWVREEHYAYGCWMKVGATKTGRDKYRFIADYKRPVYYCDTLPTHVKLCKGRNDVGYFKRLGRFMPYRLARMFITVTAVKAERLQDITEEDARAEGVDKRGTLKYVDCFRLLWDSLNSERGYDWNANNWVFAYTFARGYISDIKATDRPIWTGSLVEPTVPYEGEIEDVKFNGEVRERR